MSHSSSLEHTTEHYVRLNAIELMLNMMVSVMTDEQKKTLHYRTYCAVKSHVKNATEEQRELVLRTSEAALYLLRSVDNASNLCRTGKS